MPKRVASYFFKKFGIKSPTAFLEQLGNVARQHTSEGVAYDFDFTDVFDWDDGDFGDAGSCYWGSNEAARDMLMENGGFAIRFYNDEGEGFGRAWVVSRQPSEGFYVVFNGYGVSDSATLTAARIMSLFLSVTYKRVVLRNNGTQTGMLWINGGIGYLIGNIQVIDAITYYDLHIPDVYTCCDCGDVLHEDDVYTSPDGDHFCSYCFYERYDTCYECEEHTDRDDMIYIEGLDRDVCSYCFREWYTTCAQCEEDMHRNDTYEIEGHKRRFCEQCREDVLAEQAEAEAAQDARLTAATEADDPC
jgi:hypothetical protein